MQKSLVCCIISSCMYSTVGKPPPVGSLKGSSVEREAEGAVFSGSAIHLLAHTGNRLEVEGTAVQARWAEAATWQTFQIFNYGGGAIYSGDIVFLKAHTTLMLDVEGTEVNARWNDWGAWQQLRIQKKHGSGAVFPGDPIFLQTHTGKFIDVQGTAAQARFFDNGDWQTLVMETMASRRLSDAGGSKGLGNMSVKIVYRIVIGALTVKTILIVIGVLIPLGAMMIRRHVKRLKKASHQVDLEDRCADWVTV